MTKIQELVKDYQHQGKFEFREISHFEAIRHNLNTSDYVSVNLTSSEITDATIRASLGEYGVDLSRPFVVFHPTDQKANRFTQLYYVTDQVGVYARVAVDSVKVKDKISHTLLHQQFGNADVTGISVMLEAIGSQAQNMFMASLS